MQTHPEHVAIIMDGNGRWANARGLPRAHGHREGVKTVRNIVEAAADIGIRHLTLYSFSTENWRRPKSEIRILFDLLRRYVKDDLKKLNENGVRIRIMGSRKGLGDDILDLIDTVQSTTQTNSKFYLNIAFNYGGRDEIIRAARRAIEAGIAIDDLSEETLGRFLDSAGQPDPDLLIRTSGEKRISNYLIWQTAYSEFYFTDTLWPDFSKQDLIVALNEYGKRTRRYGAVQSSATEEVA